MHPKRDAAKEPMPNTRLIIRTILYTILGIGWTLFALLGLFTLFLINEMRVASIEYGKHGLDNMMWEMIAIVGPVILGLFIILAGLRWLLKQPLKTLRNLSANELVELSESESPAPFSLYLRPFGFTDVLKFRSGPANPGATGLIFLTETVEFEDELFQGFENRFKLIALGRPGEHLGAGRILTTDDDWQDLASTLIAKAEWLVLVPSTRPGTLWEIEFIRDNGYFSKTLIVLPQRRLTAGYDREKHKHHFKNALRDVSEWREDAEAAMAKAGLTVTSDLDSGLAVLLSNDGEVLKKEAFTVEQMDGFWATFNALFARHTAIKAASSINNT